MFSTLIRIAEALEVDLGEIITQARKEVLRKASSSRGGKN